MACLDIARPYAEAPGHGTATADDLEARFPGLIGSILAGFGLAAVQRREVSPRAVRVALAVVGAAMVAGALLTRGFPAAFPLEGPHGAPGPGVLSLLTVGVWLQFVMLAASAAAIVWVLKRPSPASYGAVILVLVVDLLNALPYDIKSDGIEYFALTAEQTQPSVHARAIGQALATSAGSDGDRAG